jgi:hypothetical protein
MFSPVKISLSIMQNIKETYVVFRKRKILPLFFLTLILIIISIIFAFLVFVPVLSPFVYPLF